MRAVRYHSHGGPEQVRVDDVPEPVPGPAEVLVRVRAGALNPIDAKILAGTAARGPLPRTLGCDFAGEVEGTGERVFGSLPGAGAARDGAFAQAVAAPRSCLAPLPPGLSFEQGAALGIVFLTAQLCVEAAPLRPGAIVAVYGAGGGVGASYLQLARRSGARLVAVTSGRGAERARERGASDVVDRTREDVFARLRQLAPDGLDVVVDTIGGSWFERGVALLAPRGRILSVGITAGERAKVELDLPAFYRKGAFVVGIAGGALAPEERGARLRAVGQALARGDVLPPEVEAFSLDRAAEAFARTAAYTHGGRKLVLIP